MLPRRHRRTARRKKNLRVVKKPEELDLNRRDTDAGPSEALSAAVVAALMLGQPAPIIAQRFGLSTDTVKRWEEAYDISNPLKRRDSLSEMLLVFVEQELASLMSISIATSDEDWIKSQKASDLSQLVGVKQDRILAVLSAYSKAQDSMRVIKGEIVGNED